MALLGHVSVSMLALKPLWEVISVCRETLRDKVIKAWMLTVCGGRGRQRLVALGQVRDAAVP